MKPLVYIALFCSVHLTGQITSDYSGLPKGTLAKNVHHTGRVRLNFMSQSDSIFNYNVVLASFEKGAKLDWHMHPEGQQLIITKGKGYYQERGKPLQIVKKGDVIKSLPGVEHWHAATPYSDCSYLALYSGEPTQWLEPISEEIYRSLEE